MRPYRAGATSEQHSSDDKWLSQQLPFLEPMKTLRVRNLLLGNRVYEFDAYRTLAFKADSGHSLLLFTNNSKDSSAKIC